MSFSAYAHQNRPRPTSVLHPSQPTRQECQWLTELQQHVARLNDLKTLLPEKRKEIEDERRNVAQMNRDLTCLQDQIHRCTSNNRWSHTPVCQDQLGASNTKSHPQKLRDEFKAMFAHREEVYVKLNELTYEHKRLRDEWPGHQQNIQYLMRQLRLVVST